MRKFLLPVVLGLIACSPASEQSTSPEPSSELNASTDVSANISPEESAGSSVDTDSGRHVYFGDLHVHTYYSFDAFIFATRATPDDAYRYAKGEAIRHPAGFDVQLKRPLDFYAVTDHAMFLGNLAAWADGTSVKSEDPVAVRVAAAKTTSERHAAFLGMRPYLKEGADNKLLDLDVVRSAWADIQAAAERHNDPGEFTTFVAYEYTSSPESQNLHRNVIFQGAAAPSTPFSRLDSANPEQLWAWMDNLRDQGIESLAIPHNSNGSNGQMFKLTDWDGNPLDAAYAEVRLRNEPLVEITQVKGTSDTHPLLSPHDEWADFEIMPYRIGTWIDSDPNGSYVRQALLNGIRMEDRGGFNPYQFGITGASDSHTGAASLDEANFFSKVGLLDATPQLRGSIPLDEPDADGNIYANTYYNTWGASGITGVWADANTRGDIYDSLRRKETFATSGTRITLRFFASFEFREDLHDEPNMAEIAYELGVPMGGDLLPGTGSPRFVVMALRDPASAPLERLQIIKGWVNDREPFEQVYDVACSDGLQVNSDTHRCPDNGARVNISDCSITEGVGASELLATWEDPEFDADQQAFYYVRALENPTCRWSTWDAVRAGVPPRDTLAKTIQERAWSSPIWIHPN